MRRVVRRMVGRALSLVLRLWVSSLRVTLELPSAGRGPQVLAFFHGQQMALLAVRRRAPLSVLVSWSDDGELQAALMRAFGLDVVRGSSSLGALPAARALLRRLRGGNDVALAVDGPRGPRGVPKNGAAFAARVARVPLVPVATAARRAWVVGGTWDAFEIPLPFTRVAVVAGDGFPVDGEPRPEELAAAIDRARERALHLVGVRTRGPRALSAAVPIAGRAVDCPATTPAWTPQDFGEPPL